MMKTFKKIWWRLLFALYAFIYLPWFFYLEHKITMDYPGIHILNGTIDSYIPFLEIFIIPYLLWFVYIAASCIYMVLKADNNMKVLNMSNYLLKQVLDYNIAVEE